MSRRSRVRGSDALAAYSRDPTTLSPFHLPASTTTTSTTSNAVHDPAVTSVTTQDASIEPVAAVIGIPALGQPARSSVPPAPGAPLALLEREFPVFDFTWTPTTPTYIATLSFPDLLFDQPAISDVIKWYRYFTGDVELRVSLAGTRFSYGACIMSWEPAAGYGDVGPYVGPVASSGYPHMLVSANDIETPTITIPWQAPQPSVCVQTYPVAALGAVDISVLVPLRSADGLTTSPQLRVTVYARFVRARVAGPLQTPVAPSVSTIVRT